MTVDVIALRHEGGNQGEDVQNVLLTNVTVAVERGRQEINKSALGTPISLKTNFKTGLEPNQLVEILDTTQSLRWRAKIKTVEIVVEGIDTYAMLQLFSPELARVNI